MQTPQKYRRKTIFTRLGMPKEVLAMKLSSQGERNEDVYRWVENGTQGSFDVNSFNSPIPKTGVSISADTGKMVVVAAGMVMTCEASDYIVQLKESFFYPISEGLFNATYKLVKDN